MIAWDKSAVANFLGVTPRREINSSPLDAPHEWFYFDLPFAGGIASLAVVPAKDFCEISHNNEYGSDALLSAYIHCTQININLEHEDEGGNCVVLVGSAGHVRLSPGLEGFHLFFSMYGTQRPTDVQL